MTDKQRWADDNRYWWNERVPIHVGSPFYGLDEFRAGGERLRPYELDEVGVDLSGVELLHLQCHIGTDTLAWARHGARVVGLDFSGDAVSAARTLAGECGLADRAEFVVSDVYEAATTLDGRQFDVVYTGIGAVNWLPDIDRWARVAASLVKPGGVLYLVEIHPFVWVFDDDEPEPVFVWDYFGEVHWSESTGSYVDRTAPTTHNKTHERNWNIGAVVSAVVGSGLRLEFVREHPLAVERYWPWLEPLPDRPDLYRAPDDRPSLPLTWSLTRTPLVRRPRSIPFVPYIYAFDHKHRKPPMDMKDLLGGKGANLAEMTSVLGLPVPAGFTITTDACRVDMREGWPTGLDAEVSKHLATLEKTMGRRLGDPADPLLVSVRSGAKFSMPGMMDTVLNLGLNDVSVQALAKQTDDERFAYDSYRRFISMYGRIVLDIEAEPFDRLLDTAKEWDGVTSDADVTAETLQRLCERYKDVVQRETGKPFPQDPIVQLKGAIEAVFRSWGGARAIAYRVRERISHDLGTAVNVQAMVFGNRDDNSGTGVGFTRNAATGENKPYGDFLINAQGEDVVAGIRNTEDLDAMATAFPKVHKQLLEIFDKLEKHYRYMCDTEFTIDQGNLWMLQTRVGKRTGMAALRMAVEMTKGRKWEITKAEAIQRITEDHLDQVLHPQFESQEHTVIAKGLAASPGAAVGRVYFTADDAADAADRGEQVILVRSETSPEDVHGMIVAEGILTARGGLVSHAAVVARGVGKPAVVGAESVRIHPGRFVAGDVVVHEGDVISVDGSTGNVVLGAVELSSAAPPAEFKTILEWADEIREGHLAVRANADNGPDANNVCDFGAEGIGLCRTEHMFLGEDRLPVVRRMILADTKSEEDAALEELRVVQKKDFEEILQAMDGLPVTVRLLDPPLHEFLPSTEELAIKQATVGLTSEEDELYQAAKLWHEFNPMLGTRGVRLGVIKPGLYAMQVRALMEAAAERVKKKGHPIIEIMIPLTITQPELTLARGWCEGAIAEARKIAKHDLDVTIGTMIETPRACLRADDIALEADFFSFGTNDLTQMALGFSRDDVEGRMMDAYIENGLLKRNPFETLDDHGVGELVRMGASRGRKAKKGLKLGVCGEHGGDPELIAIFYRAGLDYVSCSPFRVPIARLASAQAVLAGR